MASKSSGLKLLGLCGLLFLFAALAFPAQGFAASPPQFVYVANQSTNDVSGYAIDATTGALTPVPGSPFAAGTNPFGVAVDPSGKFLYAANVVSNNVSAYTIDASTGSLTPVAGSPFAAGNSPIFVAVDPSGRFVYVTNRGDNNVSGYTIDATSGALSPVAGSPFAAGSNPDTLAVDPSGKFVYVTNHFSSNVSAYTIDATTGALTPVPGSPFAAVFGPFAVAVDPSGKFLYVTNEGSTDISAYTIDATSGALTSVAGSPFPAVSGVYGVAVDPLGKFAYVTNQASNVVSAYTIDASSGALTPVAGSPFAAGSAPSGVAIGPAGRFVYVTNVTSNNVFAYTINPSSGALTPVPGSPFAAGGGSAGVAVTPACVPAPAGLVSWWRAEGNANDETGGNDGTLQNGATFATGEVGQAFSLDGVDADVKVPASPSLDVGAGSGFTVDAWINPSDVSAQRPIVEWNTGTGIYPGVHLWIYPTPGALFANVVDTSSTDHFFYTAGGVLNPGINQHVALTYDRTTGVGRIYLNGVVVAEQNLGIFQPQTSPDLYFGTRPPSSAGPFTRFSGTIDEVEIFNRALTQSELQHIFNAGAKGKCPCTPPPSGMAAWWPGEGNARDIIGGNNGTLQNGAGFGSGEVGQAFNLNGAGQFVDAGNSPSLQISAGDFTMDAWVKFNSLSNAGPCGSPNCDMGIVTKMSADGGNLNANKDGWMLIKQSDNRFWFCFGGVSGNRCFDPAFTVFSTTHAVVGNWYHVAVTKDSNSFSLYVNGQLEDRRSPLPAFLDTNSTNLLIGSRAAEGSDLNGQIDEVEIFHRALSGDEVAAIFNAGGAGKCRPRDLTCSKTASTSFDRTFTWSIQKTVDKTTVKRVGGGSATFNYTVNASQTGAPADSNYQVAGAITVTNPNDFKAFTGVNVTDAIDNGGSCVVTDGIGATVPAAGSLELPYACTYSTPPSPFSGTNTATTAWDASAHLTPHASAQGTAPYAFTNPANTFKQNVTVTDTFNSATTTLGSLTGTTSQPFASGTYTYAHTVTVPQYGCTSYPNTALVVETSQSSSQTVRVCGPVRTGAVTMGYWQSKTGQSIISTGAATAGVCNSGTWLRQYAPFQNLSATASCSAVAAYVGTVIKAANSSGASMNPMLKGQMLATALDVYFSDPALGGNRIGAPAPIGGVSIDLTQVCSMIDSSLGSATCSGTFQNTSSAFGGSSSKTVSQILSYAASQSNSGGSSWYGNVKSVQQLAKNTFDAINNQVAFAP